MTHCLRYESGDVRMKNVLEKGRLGTLDSWVILVNKVALDELDGQGGFPDT